MVLSVHRQPLMEIFHSGYSQYDLGGGGGGVNHQPCAQQGQVGLVAGFWWSVSLVVPPSATQSALCLQPDPDSITHLPTPSKKWEREDHLSIPPQPSKQQNVEDLWGRWGDTTSQNCYDDGWAEEYCWILCHLHSLYREGAHKWWGFIILLICASHARESGGIWRQLGKEIDCPIKLTWSVESLQPLFKAGFKCNAGS